ncbi:tRNA (adenosine(37)-N6)-threonylcarbamoyltransferase complex dimerization subunit type 1 TsaB [Paenibacillus eucommiae]|uniref:tRNA threonylcarbamoyladenosine biosynthesis protein TsaB n=1 Tax=Paenibacillus eucommiae TaxID=1355755 RepID=A0ABS4J594_9BACL|nr:tRNA (adenosine(37)-N6)-threonylcarbamoyltransferase complex dimerization subunit type 1 TsaB [Paenibacillus eucommiae]MBP1995000.1 tRNA threonylcarbamoyladenosine biosynthesis protein TsaB [Paenibacillus eucommiae]
MMDMDIDTTETPKININSKGLYLAMDTSTSSLTVAVLKNGHLLGELSTYAERNHSIGLLPNIQQLLTSLGLKPKDLKAVVSGKGPGSYTGVRIGVSTAKTFAWSLGIDLIGVSSLEAMALGGRRVAAGEPDMIHLIKGNDLTQDIKDTAQDTTKDTTKDTTQDSKQIDGWTDSVKSKWIIPLVDARRGQAFTGVYEERNIWNAIEYMVNRINDNENDTQEFSKWRTFIPDSIRVVEPWLEQVAILADDAQLRRKVSGLVEWGAPEHVVFVGETDSFEAQISQFAENWSGTVTVIPHLIKAQNIGLLAYPLWQKGELQELHTFAPNYAQLPEAEAKLQAKVGKGEE